MSIHIGEKIKQRAKELRMGPTELGQLINTSKQNVYGIFKRHSIDTDLLQKISKALQYDFFSHYTNTPSSAVNSVHEDAASYTKLNARNEKIQQEITLCKQEIEHLKALMAQQEIAYLKRINELLEKKKKK